MRPLKYASGRTTTLAVGVLLVVVVTLYATGHLERAVYYWKNGASPTRTIAESKQQLAGMKQERRQEKIQEYFTPKRIADLDLLYAPSFDKRMADALSNAILKYRVLTGLPISDPIKLVIRPQQIDKEWFEITFEINNDKLQSSYRLRLSNAPEEAAANVDRAEKLLRTFVAEQPAAENIGTGLTPPSDTEVTNFLAENFRFNHLGIFTRIHEAGLEVKANPATATPSMEVSELLSWLTVMKQRGPKTQLPDLLASRAMTAYLLGRIQGASDTVTGYHKGLLLVALDYPAAAEAILSRESNGAQHADLLLAYIRRDADALTEFSRDPTLNPRVTGFLLAQAYAKSYRRSQSEQTANRLVEAYPGLLIARAYLVDDASVGLARRHNHGYLESLLAAHFSVMERFLDTEWISQERTLETQVDRVVPKADVLKKWLSLHAQIVDGSTATTGPSLFIDTHFLKTYLTEEMHTGLALYYTLEAKLLGRRSEAERVADLVYASHADTDFAQALKIKLLLEYRDEGVHDELAKIQLSSANDYLLNAAEYAHRLWKPSHGSYKSIIPVMRAYRDRLNPNANGLMTLRRLYADNHYVPYARQASALALEVDPYAISLYPLEATKKHDAKIIEEGARRMPGSYGFLLEAARWYREQVDHERAVFYFLKAIEAAPDESRAYRDLGDLYAEQEEHDKAIAIWKDYLALGDRSLRTTGVQNRLGKLYRELGRHEDAYAIFEIAKESGQAGAMLRFAEESEQLGKILQAERYFKRAADRYPGGRSAFELAAFYWRQGNDASALDVIRSHKRVGGDLFYWDGLFSHYSKRGTPGQAISVLKQIEGEPLNPWYAYWAAQKLSKMDHPMAAIESLRPYTDQKIDNHWQVAEKMAIEMLTLVSMHDPKAVPETVQRIIAAFGKSYNSGLVTVASALAARGHHDAAYQMFDYVSTSDKTYPASILNKTALSWRLGPHDESGKIALIELLATKHNDAFLEKRVRFLLEESEESEYRDAARDPHQLCALHYDLGILGAEQSNEDDALKHLLLVLEYGNFNCLETVNAFGLLETL